MFDNIKDLTNENDHSAAVIELAKLTGISSAIILAAKINRRHDVAGYLADDLYAIRNKLRKVCLINMKGKLSDADYNDLYASF